MTQNNKSPHAFGKGGTAAVFVVGLIAAGYMLYATTLSNSNVQNDGKDSKTVTSAPKVAGKGGLTGLNVGAMKSVVIHKERKDVPEITFTDGQGKERSLSEWKGKVVLVNLWATWCGPCRKEMPDIADLQGEMGGDDFEVVAVSVDRKGIKASRKFLAEVKAEKLALYADQSTKILGKLKAPGLPVSVLIDRNGKEAGRLIGAARWNSAQAHTLIKALIDEK